MHGDYTRFTFNRDKKYTRVQKQQGRVDLDSDWNEYVQMVEDLRESLAINTIGCCGVPVPKSLSDWCDFDITVPSDVTWNGGFEIHLAGHHLRIMPGKIYVHGILCELNEEVRSSDDGSGTSVQAVQR